MTKEEQMFAKRLVDLSRQSAQKGIVMFSDFLDLNEQNIFHSVRSELYGSYECYGGHDFAERQMVAFLPDVSAHQNCTMDANAETDVGVDACAGANADADAGADVDVDTGASRRNVLAPKQACRKDPRIDYPIACLRIEPKNPRFAEELTHRDVLGSLMSLGIERRKLGDILMKGQDAYVFCHDSVREFLTDELRKIRHTDVSVSEALGEGLDLSPTLEHCSGVISSNRLDAVVAQMCHLSRSQSSDLIRKGLVFVNSQVTMDSSYGCKPGEILSVRGHGRFRFLQAEDETRKGRVKLEYERYC